MNKAERCDGERGIVLVLVLCGLAGLSALALTVSLLASIDTQLQAATRSRIETMAVAEAGAELAFALLATDSDWNAVLAGTQPARILTSGPAVVPGWGELNPLVLTTGLQRDSDARGVWATDNPVWRLYAHGRLASVLTTRASESTAYVVTWLGDDEADGDGAPGRDTNGVVTVRVAAYGPGRALHVVIATVRRRPHGVELLSWRLPFDRRAAS